MPPGGEGGSVLQHLTCELPAPDTLLIRLAGNWTISNRLPSIDEIEHRLHSCNQLKHITFDSAGLESWDSSLIAFLRNIVQLGERENLTIITEGLPQGVQRLVQLAAAVPEKIGARKGGVREPLLARIGAQALNFAQGTRDMLAFIGDTFCAFSKLFVGNARFQRSDFFASVQACGIESLPIVSLISLLVGLILAFVGAVQLRMFGAQIYVADLVGIAMVRVMGAIMTGIIMTGRMGAAFAAELGTMQVNEEIDALETMGISPMEFLVLPRMLALTLMMPLLCLYADLMGIVGGLIVGVGMLDLNVHEYFNQTRGAVTLTYLWIGLFHSVVFGVLIALAGCLRGMQCGRSASAVGNATTSAVVTGIVSIIVATALITVVCDVLGI